MDIEPTKRIKKQVKAESRGQCGQVENKNKMTGTNPNRSAMMINSNRVVM